MPNSPGTVAAGHQLSAEVAAKWLRAGGNAVDAALAAMLASWVTEPLLTGPGAGGYMLVAGAGHKPVLLDFFVAAPGLGGSVNTAETPLGELVGVEVSFGDTTQTFHVGGPSCGVYGNPAGVEYAANRWGSIPLPELAKPAVTLAREGVELNAQQAYVVKILEPILMRETGTKELFAPHGRIIRCGEQFQSHQLADTIERFSVEGAELFYRGEFAQQAVDTVAEYGGNLTAEDLACYQAIEREPLTVNYCGRQVYINPPPSAGGILLAFALAVLERDSQPATLENLVAVMECAQRERTLDFLEGLDQPAFSERWFSSRLGGTTHLTVVDQQGLTCSVTCTNGEGSGVVVPHTAIHLNNIMGEEDLNPAGFHQMKPGRRMPSMMSPTVVLQNDTVELALGSAGSNRIRSALLQTIVNVLEHGLDIHAAVHASRVHLEGKSLYVEPGIEVSQKLRQQYDLVPFREQNLFFGGVQAVVRDLESGQLQGAGDPRRGGVAITA